MGAHFPAHAWSSGWICAGAPHFPALQGSSTGICGPGSAHRSGWTLQALTNAPTAQHSSTHGSSWARFCAAGPPEDSPRDPSILRARPTHHSEACALSGSSPQVDLLPLGDGAVQHVQWRWRDAVERGVKLGMRNRSSGTSWAKKGAPPSPRPQAHRPRPVLDGPAGAGLRAGADGPPGTTTRRDDPVSLRAPRSPAPRRAPPARRPRPARGCSGRPCP
jgi:hypothetical protein